MGVGDVELVTKGDRQPLISVTRFIKIVFGLGTSYFFPSVYSILFRSHKRIRLYFHTNSCNTKSYRYGNEEGIIIHKSSQPTSFSSVYPNIVFRGCVVIFVICLLCWILYLSYKRFVWRF